MLTVRLAVSPSTDWHPDIHVDPNIHANRVRSFPFPKVLRDPPQFNSVRSNLLYRAATLLHNHSPGPGKQLCSPSVFCKCWIPHLTKHKP